MSISKSRRNLLVGLAAAGAAGVAGGLFLDRRNIARLALGGASAGGEIKKPKFIFVVVADGLGTISFDETSGPTGGMDGMTSGRSQLWHPWYQTVGSNPYALAGLDTDDFILPEVSRELGAFRDRSLYVRGVRLPTNTTGHEGYKGVLRDNGRRMASVDYLIAGGLPDYASVNKAVFAGHISHNASFRVSYSGVGGGGGLGDGQADGG
ncbi:hypothetical protein OHC51_03560 [Stenotrophomonas indicatrix]|uniref:hypothetical protein n=1 Tax=Stenotrophomonas indicatrix TaxID=2045451 RepID=UPI0030094975